MKKTALYKHETVSFSDTGKGRAVVLLHGFLGSRQIWKDIAANLSKSYRVIAIDLPGHGETACIGYVHSMELMAGCVKAVMDSLKLRRFVIVGHSMGGYTALAFADQYPDNLRGLCLFHSSAQPDSRVKKDDRLRAVALVRSAKSLYIKSTIKGLFAPGNLKYLGEELAFATAIATSATKRGIIAALYGMRDRPGRDMITGLVKYPVMMVIGGKDKVLPQEDLMEETRQLKNGTVLILENDGHFGFLESPRRSSRELRKFLRKCF